jgi:hypothetical protein
MKKIKISLVVAFIAAALCSISSCKKESSNSPVSPSKSVNLLQVLKKKTNGGIQANPATAMDSVVVSGVDRGFKSSVFPPDPFARMYGNTYAEWSAKWWKWGMEHPMAGHPFIDDPGYNVRSGQSGDVWFLAAPFGTVVRSNVIIPADKALYVGIINAEGSDLEGLGNTYPERRAYANFVANHIVKSSLFCTVDGSRVTNIKSYRFESPEFKFYAPTPWIFGDAGGRGKSVGDGYYVMIKPFSERSHHTIHFGGAFHFAISEGDPFDFDASIDMTYNLIVRD